MIERMVTLLSGKDNEKDIKNYTKLVSLFGISSIANGVRCNIVIPTDLEEMPINLFGIGMGGSGISKTKTVNYVTTWMDDAWNDIKKLGNENLELMNPFDTEELGDLTKDGITLANTYKSMTDASLLKLLRVLDLVDYSSVNYVVDEIGSVLGRDYELLSSTVLEIYDRGKTSVNLRASSKVKKANNPIPMCMLAFGSPHLLFESDANTEKMFIDLLQAGFARRTIFVNVTTAINKYNLVVDDTNRAEIEAVKQRFRDIVSKYDHKTLSLTSEAKQLYLKYSDDNTIESSEISEYKSIQKIYAKSKSWLALKLSGVVAVSNLHDDVTKEDFEYAMEVIEDSYLDLVSLLNRPDKYEIVVNYLLEQGTTESEYTLTKDLPFYKEIKNKRQFLELAKGYAFNNNITLQIQDKHNVTFYSARGKVKTDLEKPLMFSYSSHITEGYYTNDNVLWKDFHKVVSRPDVCYSAHSFKDGYRSKDNTITGFQLIILDIDNDVDLETAKVLFNDYTYLIATTKSHQVDKKGIICDRFRIVLPMEYALDLEPETYSKMMKNLFADLPIEVDTVCSDSSRFYYGAEGQYFYNEGVLINCDKYVDYTNEKELYDKEGAKLSKKNINGISQYIIRNQHNGRNSSLLKLSLLLIDKGYSHQECKDEITRVNNQFDNPLSLHELERTIFKTLSKKEEKVIEYEDDDEDEYEDDDIFNKVD